MTRIDEFLARKRVEARRSSPDWGADQTAAGGPGLGGDGSSFLAQATALHDTSRVQPSNRLAWLKRVLMRLVAFYTERQVAFNRNVVQALDAQSRSVARSSQDGSSFRSQTASDLEDLRSFVGEQGAAITKLLEQNARLEREVLTVRTASQSGNTHAQADEDLKRQGVHTAQLAALYKKFEDRFRGEPKAIEERVAEYVPLVRDRIPRELASLPFLDVGCGRGELVIALRGQGVPAEGVEANPLMADEAEDAGVPVHRRNLFHELRDRPAQSLSGVSAIQVVEHLAAEHLLEFLELAWDKLAPGGVLLLETIDVRSLHALRWFFADATHRLPLMPETLRFYAEAAGFAEIDTIELHPARSMEPTGDDHVDDLYRTVFGPQDFALLAHRPASVVENDPAAGRQRNRA